MKYLITIIISLTFLFSNAQEPSDTTQYKIVFAELLGTHTNLLGIGKSATVEVDFGEEYFKWIPDNRNLLVDENGKAIKFNSMVDAMNYMGERGWKFEAAYVVTVANQNVIHWLMSKVIPITENARKGIIQGRDLKKKKKKQEHLNDPIYGN